MKKTTFFCLFLFILASLLLFAENIERPDYVRNENRIFFEAQEAFDLNNYGLSLSLLEQAKKTRRNIIAWEVYTLENSLKPAEVKIVGNNLNDILRVFEGRKDYDAIDIVNRYSDFYGLETFESSAPKLLAFIKSRSYFPEADYLAGQIYQIEGEYEVSERLFMQAYEGRSNLDVPEQAIDILYSLADIAYTMKDYKRYEEFLVAIVSQDRFYKDAALLRSVMKTISSNDDASAMERFFKMYRTDNFRVLNAYFALSEFYKQRNENNRSLNTSALGILTAISKIYSVVSSRNPEFSYKDLASFLEEAATHDDVIAWGKDNNVWKGFNDFAEIAYNSGSTTFGKKLYEVLKDCNPDTYWKKDAVIQFKKIN